MTSNYAANCKTVPMSTSQLFARIQSKTSKKRQILYPKSVSQGNAKIDNSPNWHLKQLQTRKYLAFGDSFVSMFLHVKNAFHIKLKGKSLRGLSKMESQKTDRQLIQKWISYTNQNTQLIFNFGQVDLNLMRYYKIIHKEKYSEECFQDYVEWISKLKRKCIVLAILPSPIDAQHIIRVLHKYGTILPEDGITDFTELLEQHEQTQKRRQRWNSLIQKACIKRGVSFINAFEHNKQLDERFLDQNPQTIHLRYLPTIIQIKKHIQLLDIDIQKANQIEEQYEKVKTDRYKIALKELEEQKKKLQSSETKIEESTSSNNNGSESEDLERETSNDKIGDHDNDQTFQNKPRNENLTQQQRQQKQRDKFIKNLEIPGVNTTFDFFDKLLERSKQNKQNFTLFVSKIVQKGLQWRQIQLFQAQQQKQRQGKLNKKANQKNQNQQFLLCLFKDIYSLQSQSQPDELQTGNIQASKLFFKTFVSILQSKYQYAIMHLSQKMPYSYKQQKRQKPLLQCLIENILFIKQMEDKYQMKVISQKIILVITREIVLKLYERIEKNELGDKYEDVYCLYNCLESVVNKYGDKINQLFLKKGKITETQAKIKILEILFACANKIDDKTGKQNEKSNTETQQPPTLLYLTLTKTSPNLLYSKAVLKQLLHYIQLKILLKQTSSKMSSIQKQYEKLSVKQSKRIKRLLEQNKLDFSKYQVNNLQHKHVDKVFNQYKKKYCKCMNCFKLLIE